MKIDDCLSKEVIRADGSHSKIGTVKKVLSDSDRIKLNIEWEDGSWDINTNPKDYITLPKE